MRKHFQTDFKIDYKDGSTNNPVTAIDKLSEKMIIEKIQQKFSDHNILTEESGIINESKSSFRWVIDPLDGTNNYSHQHPFFNVSIGLQFEEKMIVGVVYAPIYNELFQAAKGLGAFLNKKPIHVSTIEKIPYAILGTGFSYQKKEQNFPCFEHFTKKAQGIRRCGAAALELAYLAAGRQDGFWEFGLKAWDFAAAQVLIEEAGGKITNIAGQPLTLNDTDILASNTKIHLEMLENIQMVQSNILP